MYKVSSVSEIMSFHGHYLRMCVLLALNVAALSQTSSNSSPTTQPPPFEFPRNSSDVNFLVNSTIRDSLEQHTMNASETEDMNKNSIRDNLKNVFPANSSDVNFLMNSTIRKNLEQHTMNDSETSDMSKDGKMGVNSIGKMVFTKNNFKNVMPQNSGKEDAELIQTDENVEVETPGAAHGRAAPAVHGQLTAILAGIFLVVAVAAYAALLSWRRFLENRYGNREMLVNEEEFNDPTDNSHFSL